MTKHEFTPSATTPDYCRAYGLFKLDSWDTDTPDTPKVAQGAKECKEWSLVGRIGRCEISNFHVAVNDQVLIAYVAYKDDAELIASVPALKAENERLREALAQIARGCYGDPSIIADYALTGEALKS